MAKQVQDDISRNKREIKKVLRHVEKEELCDEDKCVLVERKQRRLDEQDK